MPDTGSDVDVERQMIRDYVRKNFETEKRKRRNASLVLGLILPLVLALVGWGVAGNTPLAGMILMSVALGLSVMFHFISTYVETEAGVRELKRQLVVEARIKKSLGLLDVDEILEEDEPAKAKRDEAVRLSDDGELVPDDLIDESERRARRASK